MTRLQIMVNIINAANIARNIYILKCCDRFGHAIFDFHLKYILTATFGTNVAGPDKFVIVCFQNDQWVTDLTTKPTTKGLANIYIT